jgi:hypothetical protein
MLAAMTSVFTASRVSREAAPRKAFCQLPQLGGQFVERRLFLGGKCLAEDLPVFGLGRATVARGATLQAGDQLIIQIAYVQISSHPALREITGTNALILGPFCQEQRVAGRELRFGGNWRAALSEIFVDRLISKRPNRLTQR